MFLEASFRSKATLLSWAWRYLTPAGGVYIFSRLSPPLFPCAKHLPGWFLVALLPTAVSGLSRRFMLTAMQRFTIQPLSGHANVSRGAGNRANHRVIPPDTLSPSLCAEGFLMALLSLRQKRTISKVTEINFSSEIAWHAAAGQGA